MANLASAVNATEPLWTISADLDDDIDYLTVESEIVKITGNFPAGRDPQTLLPVAPRIRVERGAGGTTAASHADTTALTPLIPPAAGGGGGGAIAVDNTVDPPAEVTTLIAPGADVSTPGEANLGAIVSILQTTVTLTNAQIKALNATYVEVVPTPGAGNLLVMISAALVLDTSAGAYTGADEDCYFEIVYGDWDGDASVSTFRQTTDDALENAFTNRWVLTPVISEETAGTYVGYDVSSGVNAPLKIALFNTSGALGGGNAANTLKVSVWYGIFEV